MAGKAGFEPATARLTAGSTTTVLLANAWSGYGESNPDRQLGRLSSDLRYPRSRVFPRRPPKTLPTPAPYCTGLAGQISRHPGACEVRVRGLPVFSCIAALPAYPRPVIPFGPHWQWVPAHPTGNKKPGAMAGFMWVFAEGKIIRMAKSCHHPHGNAIGPQAALRIS